tara:strand:- start:175 stop:924 length:750 start_codon:yes stop_codon:yes gene_type:complete
MVYEYIVNNPVKFIDHFSVKKDTSVWNGEYYEKVSGKKKRQISNYPQREQMMSLREVFTPKSNYSKNHCTTGLYLLLFTELKVYYVGIAAIGENWNNEKLRAEFERCNNCEFIEMRMKKHIAKINGSYVGDGVNHTNEEKNNHAKNGWRFYAKKIFNDHRKKNKEYNMDDLYLVTINVDEKYRRGREGKKDYKARLEFIEKKLSNPEDIEVKKILKDLGCNDESSWTSINKQGAGKESHKFIFKFSPLN